MNKIISTVYTCFGISAISQEDSGPALTSLRIGSGLETMLGIKSFHWRG